ncbi:MAG: hypothetical protein ACFBRM_07645 [Pikeienuella sp.]
MRSAVAILAVDIAHPEHGDRAARLGFELHGLNWKLVRMRLPEAWLRPEAG